MPYVSKEPLYTDRDPVADPIAGRVLPENDPDAKFVLCGAGGSVPDNVAAKYNLKDHEAFSEHNAVAAKAELVRANLATYEENARTVGGPTYKGIPGAESNPIGVKPDEQERAQVAVSAPVSPPNVPPLAKK